VLPPRLNRRWWHRLSAAALALLVLAGCAGGSGAKIQQESAETSAPTTTPTVDPVSPDRVVCEDGRLLLSDLELMDAQVKDGLNAAEAEAKAWQSDVKLNRLRVGCQLFEAKFRWQATYYSEKLQTFYSSDTGETEPAEISPAEVAELPTTNLSFGMVHRSLIKAGFGDGDVISPSSGVDIRFNTQAQPFGPPSAPKDTVIYHVSIERQGETKDVFISGTDGSIYRYGSDGQ
jgi:hypothetical protein